MKMEVKRNFVRFVSHEMRTPLNAAFMGLRLAKQRLVAGKPKEEVLATIEEVNEACEISIGILNDILSYDKISGGGGMQLEYDSVNAMEFLSSTVQLFKMQVRISILNRLMKLLFCPQIYYL